MIGVYLVSHPLDGPRIKIARAKEHFDTLERYLRMWRDMNPYHAVLYPDPENARYIIRMEVGATPPPEWGGIIGDFAFNLRSALDQTAYQLAKRFCPTLTERELRAVQFPVFAEEPISHALHRRWERQTRYLGVAYDFVESLQPYHVSVLPKDELLWILHEQMNNADKHRVITALGHQYRLMVPTGEGAIFFQGMFNHGDVIGYSPLSSPQPSFNPNLAGHVVFDIGNPIRGAGLNDLWEIHQLVADYIFPVLSCFFPE